MKINIFLALAFLVIQTISCSAQSPDKNLDKNLTKIYKESNFPGFAISIIKGDSTLYAKSYGYAGKNGQIDHHFPVQIDHQYRSKLTTTFQSKLTT